MRVVARWRVMTLFALLLVLGGSVFARSEQVPDRLRFSLFPSEVAGYRSIPIPVANDVLRALKLTDHLSRSYYRDGLSIGLYVGYHAIQRQGSNIHSPLHCLPGGGWSILDRQRVPMPGRSSTGRINRLLIGSGEQRQLVYYWYQGRGRVIAGEVSAIWYQLRDIVLRDRSDAALVRFMIQGADPDDEEALLRFIEASAPLFELHVPA